MVRLGTQRLRGISVLLLQKIAVAIVAIGNGFVRNLSPLWPLVFFDVEFVVCQAAEEPLSQYIVQRLPIAIHGDLHPARVQNLKVGLACKLASLIRVHDLGFSFALGTLKAAQDKLLLEVIADLVVDDPAAIPVNDNKAVQEALLEEHIGDIDPPYLVV